MGLLSGLFGRKRVSQEASANAIFAVATAQVSLEIQHRMVPTGKAGVCFRPIDSSFFTDLEREVQAYLTVGAKSSGTRYNVKDDGYGSRWVILQDEQFEDLVTGAYMVTQAFGDHGFQKRLLAAVFPFRQEGQEVQWIYSCQRGTFYPFVPLPGTQRRDNSLELSLSGKVATELPMEKDLGRWYPLWDAPFDAL